jgi:hypothetical protein
MDRLAGLDAAQWQLLHHAYGRADDVPGHVRSLASPDPRRRHDALVSLYGMLCHQGTRFQASSYAVPFLVALIDDPTTPDRAAVMTLLSAIVQGHMRDDLLPFDPNSIFAPAIQLTDEQYEFALHHMFREDADWNGEDMDLVNLVGLRWEADAYYAAAAHVDTNSRWLADPDTEVASRAAALLAWFPPTEQTIDRLVAVPTDSRHEIVRASANLTLAHHPTSNSHVDHQLHQMLAVSSMLIQITAAIALAYRLGQALPDPALNTLIYAKEADTQPSTPPGWDRAMRGFVALALQRIGLG